MRKLKLFVAALAFGAMSANAQVMIETDLTSQFNSLATNSWNGSSGQVGWAAPAVTTNSGLTVAAWERYNGSCYWTGDIMYTTVTGLTAGTYKIELFGAAAFTFGRGFGSEAFTGDPAVDASSTYTENQSITENTGVVLYATTSEGTVENEIPIWYATNFNTSGISTAVLNNVVVGEDGQIKIGLSKTSNSTNWHVVQLKGVTATVDGDAVIANLKATAKALLENATYQNVTGNERTALQAAYEATPAEQTVEAYKAVIDALNAAIATFENVDYKAYDTYANYRAETVSLFGEEVAASVAAPTTAAEAATAVQDLNVAQYNKVKADYKFSLSGIIGDFGSWVGTATVNGAAATPNYLTSEHWSGESHAYYEQASNGWGSDAWTIKYEKTCTLPAGSYVIKVAARASEDVTGYIGMDKTAVTVALPNVGANSRGINKAGEASWTEGEFARNGEGYGWQWRFLPFTLDEESEVTLTVYGETNKKYNWMSIADGELLSATDVATAVAYDEAEENEIEAVEIANVTMTRTVKEGFNTVVLPFTLTANQVAEAFGTGTEVYTYENPSEVTINFWKNDGSITANVPVLIKATKASNEQVFEGVKVEAAKNAVVEGTSFLFIGTYEPVTIDAGDYFVGNGAIYKSAGATSLKAFRAYIANANKLEARIFIDGVETTGIEGIEMVNSNNGKIYNLAGQEVKNAQKGLYIQNGKKYVVK